MTSNDTASHSEKFWSRNGTIQRCTADATRSGSSASSTCVGSRSTLSNADAACAVCPRTAAAIQPEESSRTERITCFSLASDTWAQVAHSRATRPTTPIPSLPGTGRVAPPHQRGRWAVVCWPQPARWRQETPTLGFRRQATQPQSGKSGPAHHARAPIYATVTALRPAQVLLGEWE